MAAVVDGDLSNGIAPDCNPAQTDLSQSDACGLPAFLQLIYNVIKYVSLVIIPVAVLLIGWGGFQIMTAAGSSEKVSAGQHTIQIAITGMIILLLSYLIVKGIFAALQVQSGFGPTNT